MIRRDAAAWAVPAAVLLATFGVLGLFEPTETRYAEIAREMLRTGDWLVPRLNGIAHFHKPPVAYWGAAAGMAAVGMNEWGARLFTALCAALLFPATARLARRLAGAEAAAVAPLVLGGTLLFAALSRQLSTDVPLAACVAWFWVAFLSARDRGTATLAPFLALAAGFMTKGPVIFLHTLMPLAGVALLMRGRDATWAPLRRIAGWAVFAALALPWFAVVALRHDGLLGYFVGDQVWARYTTTIHGRAGPWFYFAVVLLAGALPWTYAVLADLARRARAAFRAPGVEAAILVSWVALPVAFFSTSGSKLPAYVLPEMVPAAILAAAAVTRPSRHAVAITAALAGALAIAVETLGPGALGRALGADRALPLPPAAHVAALAWGAAALTLAARRVRVGAWCAWAALVAVVFAAAPLEGPLGSPRPLARAIARVRATGEPVVEYGSFCAGLPFYLRTRAVLVEVPRDLQFETRDDPPPVAGTDRIAELARSRGRVWLYAPRGAAQSLADTLGLVSEHALRWRDREVTALAPAE